MFIWPTQGALAGGYLWDLLKKPPMERTEGESAVGGGEKEGIQSIDSKAIVHSYKTSYAHNYSSDLGSIL